MEYIIQPLPPNSPASVVPAWFPPQGFGRISLRLKRESRRNPGLDPRLKHSGVTILEFDLFTQAAIFKRFILKLAWY
jgi:hypothetical protein